MTGKNLMIRAMKSRPVSGLPKSLTMRPRRTWLTSLAGLPNRAAHTELPLGVPAAEGQHQRARVLLLSCVDFRMVENTARYMSHRGFAGRYDHLQLAGASLGALANDYPSWRQTFWQHLNFLWKYRSIELVVILDHRDCKAYEMILGRKFSKQEVAEKTVHAGNLQLLKTQIQDKYPDLEVELGLMALNGSVDSIT